jgi:hypothetical protein
MREAPALRQSGDIPPVMKSKAVTNGENGMEFYPDTKLTVIIYISIVSNKFQAH